MSEPIKFPLLWYTSGTPMRVGQQDCAYKRWFEYHAGPHGTGYRSTRTAVPLATGAAVHTGMELIGKWMLDWQRAHVFKHLLEVPDEVIAWAATEAADRYEASAKARGLELTKTDLDAYAAVEQLILEQRTLIEAQVWMYAIVRLPYMTQTRRLIDVEFEETPVIDCTCGLGDWFGTDVMHAARGCTGIVAMGKADFLWEVAIDTHDAARGTIDYEEFKTKATPNYGWENAWEHSGQLFRNMESASRRLGKDVSRAYVPVLYKGRRDRWDREDKSSPKVQQSPLVYGWFDPGNEMNRPPTWASRYKSYDDYGKGHNLPRTFSRQGIWDESVALPLADNLNNWAGRPGASRVEQWVKGWITPGQHVELVKVLGPFPKPAALVPEYTQSLLTEERRWRSEVDYLRSLELVEPSSVTTINVDETLSTITPAHVIARSWNCTSFDGTPCFVKPICHKHAGWDDVLSMGRYEIRTPHHGTEKAAVEALGVVFPVDEDDDESGDE